MCLASEQRGSGQCVNGSLRPFVSTRGQIRPTITFTTFSAPQSETGIYDSPDTGCGHFQIWKMVGKRYSGISPLVSSVRSRFLIEKGSSIEMNHSRTMRIDYPIHRDASGCHGCMCSSKTRMTRHYCPGIMRRATARSRPMSGSGIVISSSS